MRENCTSGIAPGAPGNRRSYGGGSTRAGAVKILKLLLFWFCVQNNVAIIGYSGLVAYLRLIARSTTCLAAVAWCSAVLAFAIFAFFKYEMLQDLPHHYEMVGSATERVTDWSELYAQTIMVDWLGVCVGAVLAFFYLEINKRDTNSAPEIIVVPLLFVLPFASLLMITNLFFIRIGSPFFISIWLGFWGIMLLMTFLFPRSQARQIWNEVQSNRESGKLESRIQEIMADRKRVDSTVTRETSAKSDSIASRSDDVAEQKIQEPLQKLNRNDRCSCGSGKRYKHCCGRVDTE
jgi:hypothetical protein